MEFELKPISRDAVPEALQKVERYRLLNEPEQAESICHDVLAVAPDNQQAVAMLLLAITDQFGSGGQGAHAARAREVLKRFQGEYERAYYAGVIWERTARAQLRQGSPNAAFNAYDAFRKAMDCYEQAERIRPAGNDDALLRWNCCARTLMRNKNLRPRPEDTFEAVLGE